MKRTLFLIVLFLLSCISIAQAENRLDIVDNKVIAETNNYVVHFESGTLTYLHNKLTSETYTTTTGVSLASHLIFAGKLGYGDEKVIFAKKFINQRIGPLKVNMVYENDGNVLTNSIEIDLKTGDLIIQQKATSDKTSLASVDWSLNNLMAKDIEVIIPSNDGISVDATSKVSNNFEYPSPYWQAQFVIFQSSIGGFWVRSTDSNFRYKSFVYERKEDIYQFQFQTDNDAPFDNLQSIESVEWRINAYSGDWQVPAQQYRNWMEQTFSLQEKPEWINDITFVITGPIAIEVPLLLKSHGIIPEQTIYIIGIADEDFTIKKDAPDFVKKVRAMGFRVFFSANPRGIFPNEKHYDRFKKYQIRNPYSGGGAFHGIHGSMQSAWHIYVNLASKEWREYYISHMKRIYEMAPADGFFLDVSHLVPNDNNGHLYETRSPQGAILFREELRKATSEDITFIGEWNHEGFFAQGSFYSNVGEPNPHPISSFIFRPYIKGLGERFGPDTNSDTFYKYLDAMRIRDQLPAVYVWHAYHLDTNDPRHQIDAGHIEIMKLINTIAQWNMFNYHWTELFLTSEPALTYDVNTDGNVNILDLVLVANAFGKTRPDINGDGIVNILDLVLVANNFN